MAESLLQLENGLEIWRVAITEVREQDMNARAMDPKIFDRLTATIRRDSRLESLPLLAVTEKWLRETGTRHLEIVSGHHRVRAAIAAGLKEFFALVDTSGLNRDQIRAKQLAHNAIQGRDNDQLVAQIYSAIADAESRLEACVDVPVTVELPSVNVPELDLKMDYRAVAILFLRHEKERFDRVVEAVSQMDRDLYLADMAAFEPFRAAVKRVMSEYEVKAASTAVVKMSEIVMESLGQEEEVSDRVSLRDLFRTSTIPVDAVGTIKSAVDKMLERGQVTKKNLWQVLEFWAADYLAGN